MATHRLPILNSSVKLDDGIALVRADDNIVLATGTQNSYVYKIPDPNGGGDHGLEGIFQVPQNYVGTPLLIATYVVDTAPGGTNISFGAQFLAVASGESADQAYSAEIASSAADSNAEEDVVERSFSISAVTFAVADTVFWKFYLDDSPASPYTGIIWLTGLFFGFADA